MEGAWLLTEWVFPPWLRRGVRSASPSPSAGSAPVSPAGLLWVGEVVLTGFLSHLAGKQGWCLAGSEGAESHRHG